MVRGTEQEWADAIEGDAEIRSSDDPGTKRSPSQQAVAKGETPRGSMNKTERRWSVLLDNHDDVIWWEYEIFRVRYGEHGWYAVDFLTLLSDQSLVAIETKAHVTDAGRTRYKAGVRAVPVLRWMMVQQSSPESPWECVYDTGDQDGAPFL